MFSWRMFSLTRKCSLEECSHKLENVITKIQRGLKIKCRIIRVVGLTVVGLTVFHCICEGNLYKDTCSLDNAGALTAIVFLILHVTF